MDLTPLDPPTETPWIPVDPLHPDLERFPRFKYARPIVVKVKAGEMLYLPGELHTYTGFFFPILTFLHYQHSGFIKFCNMETKVLLPLMRGMTWIIATHYIPA